MSVVSLILVGVIIYFLSQLANNLFIEPIRELNKCKKEICQVLSFNRNKYLNPGSLSKEELSEISDKIRKVATELLSVKNMLRRNKVFFILIKEKKISKAVDELFGLSSNIGKFLSKGEKKVIYSYENDIEKALNIKFK